MPLNISRPDRRLLSIVAALFVVVIVLGLLLSPNSGQSREDIDDVLGGR